MTKLLVVASSLIACVISHAAEVPVYNTNNAFAGSLRQAIHDATPGDTIVFRIPTSDPGYNSFTNTFTITLTGEGGLGTIGIDKSLTIDGGRQKIVVQRSYISSTPTFGLFFCVNGPVTFANLTLRNGSNVAGAASGGIGGAIYNHTSSTAAVRNCTLVGNYADVGGAIFNNEEGVMVITNSTITQNSASLAAIVSHGYLTINNSTVSGNTSTGAPCGGLYDARFSAGGPVRIRNTIVAGNFGSGSNHDVQGDFISEGYNLIGMPNGVTSGFGATGDQVGVSPAQVNLGVLQDNGGPTPTMVPGGASLATDQGKRGAAENGLPIDTDQRYSRSPVDLPGIPNAVGGDGSDIGAVENGLPQTGPNFVVTNTAAHSFAGCTEDDCTLREALNASNASADTNVINFAAGLAGTIITPSSAGFQIANPVTINGPGVRSLTVSAQRGGRVFQMLTSGDVVISGLRISEGSLFQANGAGILVASGNLTLIDCLLVNHSVFQDTTNGGALYNASGATLNLVRCTVSGNDAGQFGGGVYNEGTFTATNCTFASNRALRGGAILSRAAGGASRMTLRNCTVAGNLASDGVNMPGFGGGGVFAEGNSSQYFASNNIIAGNTATNDPDIRGNYTSQGSNLIGKIGDAVGFTNGASGDKVGTVAAPLNAQLGSFGSNGGHTDTWSLLANSPAIDAGNDALAPATDQRHFTRNGTSDIGAFEANGSPPPVSLLTAVSRKTHGSSGTFEINLPLTGNPGVECRSGGANGDYTVVFKFTYSLASVGSASVTSGTGFVSSSQIGSDAREYIVNLSGVANAQRVTVTLANVTDSLGSNSPSVALTLGVLVGDTSGNGFVSTSDIGQVKSQSGQPVTASTFRSDVTASGGSINTSDIGLVKSVSGTQLP